MGLEFLEAVMNAGASTERCVHAYLRSGCCINAFTRSCTAFSEPLQIEVMSWSSGQLHNKLTFTRLGLNQSIT